MALSSLFEAVKIVNGAKDRGEVLNDADYDTLAKLFTEIVSDVLGLTDDRQDSTAESVISCLLYTSGVERLYGIGKSRFFGSVGN